MHIVEAATHNRLDVIQAAVVSGTDVDARCPSNGSTALIAAAERGYQDVVEWLVAHGAELNCGVNLGIRLLTLQSEAVPPPVKNSLECMEASVTMIHTT